MSAGLGPAPATATAGPASLPSRAMAGVLDLLAGQSRPVTAAELAGQGGLHPNTVREHLDALVERGLATRTRAEASGRGRPAWLYAAVPDERPAAREYAGLATALARQLARTSGNPREDALEAGRAWGAELAEARVDAGGGDSADIRGGGRDGGGDRHPTHPTPARARRHVVELLDGLGFAPLADARAQTVRLRRCPLLEAAREQPEVVCSVHLGIVRGALDSWGTTSDATSLVPFAEPGACLLHLTGATTRPGGPGREQ